MGVTPVGSVASVSESRPEDLRVGPLRTVWRGMRRRCGRCGGGQLFDGWFRLKEQCPTCGYTFRREEGFYTGVYFINICACEGFILVPLLIYVVWRGATDSNGPLWPVLTACVGFAVVAPIVAYPFAATTWAALDLVLRPLEPDEEADAATWVASQAHPGA